MPSDELFAGLFVPQEVRQATGGRAWLQAMLDFESGLAAAEARAGLVPAEAARAIAEAARADRFDPEALAAEARSFGNPAAPLVRALREAVGEEGAAHVHRGATSQDVLDTAAMLVARRALQPIGAQLRAVAAACARLAEEHRATPMAGRTLLQQAVPITFGLKAAGWLAGVDRARARLGAVPLAAQLGGAAGTLAALGGDGPRVAELLAEELGLPEPALPWHTERGRVGELGAALALCAGALEKVALDVELLAQSEVGEVAESSAGARGGSSTMPHKRNPVGSALAIACARRVRGATSVLIGGLAQEHERAAGAWQAEWEPLSEALAVTGGAAFALREALEGLEVRPDRMRDNMAAAGGLALAEAVATALAGSVGGPRAKQLVEAASARAAEAGTPLRDQLLADDEIRSVLSAEEVDRALDPAAYLGSAELFVERALAAHREFEEGT